MMNTNLKRRHLDDNNNASSFSVKKKDQKGIMSLRTAKIGFAFFLVILMIYPQMNMVNNLRDLYRDETLTPVVAVQKDTNNEIGENLEKVMDGETPDVAIDDDYDYDDDEAIGEAIDDDDEAIDDDDEAIDEDDDAIDKDDDAIDKDDDEVTTKETDEVKEPTKETDEGKEPTKETDEPPKPHPFAGARDSDGKWGYVADLTSVQKRHLESYSMSENFKLQSDSPHYDYVCETPPGKGWEGAQGIELMQKVQIGAPTPTNDTDTMTVSSTITASNIDQSVEKKEIKKPKLLCAIYSYETNHPRIESIANSWAWKCDGFFVASTLTNETIGTVDLPHEGPEAYNNMWQKTRSIWAYIHDNYVDDYDFFWLGGDDFFLVVENLVNMLASIQTTEGSDKPLYLGKQVPMSGGVFCGGGAGYVLNKVAVKRFIAEALPTCHNETIISAEDRFMSMCMKSIGMLCESTTDAKGQQRFLGMDPQFMAIFKGDRGYFKRLYDFWGEQSGGFKWGVDLISEQSIGFHNLRYPAFMERIYAVFFPEACPSNSTFAKGMALLKQSENDPNGEEEEEEETADV